MLIWPVWPMQGPYTANQSFIDWLRNLPTLGQVMDGYGMDSRLNLVFYHLHSSFGLASFFLILFLCLYRRIGSNLFLFIFGLNLAVLSLINESLLPSITVSSFLFLLLGNNRYKQILNKENIKLFAVYSATGLIVLFQGGMVTDGLIRGNSEHIVGFVSISEMPTHLMRFSQQTIKILPVKPEWMPFLWIFVDLLFLYFTAIVLLLFVRRFSDRLKTVVFSFLLISAIVSNFLFYFVYPKYMAPDGNRFLGSTYQFLGIAIGLGWVAVLEFFYLRKKFLLLILFTIAVLWILTASSLPQIGEFIYPRYQQNFFLEPEYYQSPPLIQWLDKNVHMGERVMDLAGYTSYRVDKYIPYSSDGRVSQYLAPYAGVLTPYWDNKYRVYMYAPGPDFMDILYTINPSSLKRLKLSYLVIDKQYFDTLPKIRQEQINNTEFFSREFIADYNPYTDYWIAVFKISDKFLNEGQDLPETNLYLDKLIPVNSDIYIERDSDPYTWLQIRNSIILTLKERRLWLYPGKGGYGYLSTDILYSVQKDGQRYDYLILKKETNPETVCSCLVQDIWHGFRDQAVVWEVK